MDLRQAFDAIKCGIDIKSSIKTSPGVGLPQYYDVAADTISAAGLL